MITHRKPFGLGGRCIGLGFRRPRFLVFHLLLSAVTVSVQFITFVTNQGLVSLPQKAKNVHRFISKYLKQTKIQEFGKREKA